jgi:hypothetical protein
MEAMEWEPEYFGEDYPTEWEPEFIPGIPSPSAAIARRFFPPRRRLSPARRPTRPVGAPSTGAPMTAAVERMRALDERQRATATQLAMVQQRSAVQQSSMAFGPVLTGAAGALALGLASPRRDWFSPAVTAGLPLMQLLVTSRGTALTSGFRSNPWSTLGFPAAAVLLAVLRDKIPGAGTAAASTPDLTFAPGAGNKVNVFVKSQRGVVFRFTLAATGSPGDPTKADRMMVGPVPLAAGESIKVRAFAGDDSGPVIEYKA